MNAVVHGWLERLSTLQPGQVAACIVSLRGFETSERELITGLSEEELERAATFRFEPDRRRFVLTHRLLRCVVGRQLAVSPSEVRLSTKLFERPRIVGTGSPGCISLSHAGPFAAVAIARTGLVGIDVEPWERKESLAGVEELALTGSEAEALRQLPAEGRLRAFLRCWCGKEAIAKALGTGLSVPLHGIEIGIDADGRVPCQRFEHAATGQWFDLRHVDVGDEGCACIAVGPSADSLDVVTGDVADFLQA